MSSKSSLSLSLSLSRYFQHNSNSDNRHIWEALRHIWPDAHWHQVNFVESRL